MSFYGFGRSFGFDGFPRSTRPQVSADIALTATARSITKAHREKIELAKARLTRNIKTKGPLSLFVCILKISDLDLSQFVLSSFHSRSTPSEMSIPFSVCSVSVTPGIRHHKLISAASTFRRLDRPPLHHHCRSYTKVYPRQDGDNRS